MVRRFPENGMKLLLENPNNVRDLLCTAGIEATRWIDFDSMQPVRATFVHRDYRHVEADVVLSADVNDPSGGRWRPRSKLLIYVLIEHQSEPDPLILLRVLDYVVQIFKHQERQWRTAHRSLHRFRLSPVLPVVFYTGARRWACLGKLADLIEPVELARRLAPTIEPIFLNLSAMDAHRLESEGGFFGWVLRLVREAKSRPEQFHALINRAIKELEGMASTDRLRWLELLSYIYALVYHMRRSSERLALQRTIERSVQNDPYRQELFEMGKTIAEELKKEGIKEGESRGMLKARQEMLIRLLRRRFGKIPQTVVETVTMTRDARELDRWLDNVVTAEDLTDIGMGAAR